MKKEITPKYEGHKSKTSDEKKGNPKTQGAQIKDLQRKTKAILQTKNHKPLPHRC
jgi:hypothetical protein